MARILLTGASGYIGSVILQELLLQNFEVVAITSKKNEELDEFKSQFPSVEILTHSFFSEEIKKRPTWLKFDGVIFSSGINEKHTAKNLTAVKSDRSMSVNYTFIVQIISELMQEKAINKGASIVFISSISSIHFSVSNAAYSASKAALEAYANTLVLELAPQKIRVNIIRPGLLEGKMKDSYALDDSISNFVQKIPLKRLGTAQDISNMVMFLLSDKSSWMTGTTIDIDGGIKFI